MGDDGRVDGTVISVSGEARHVVAPDLVTILTTVRFEGPDKDSVLQRVTFAHAAVLDGLRSLGAVALTVSTTEAPLTWSTRSFSAHIQYEHEPKTGRRRPAGWAAFVPVSVVLRELSRLHEIATMLASVPDLEIVQVEWSVDPRNRAWPVVRSAAIQDAIVKARDYAASLGGQLTVLLHVADAGLLAGGAQGREIYEHKMRAVALSGSAYGDEGAPTLDPVPQEISAVVEARFEAQVSAL